MKHTSMWIVLLLFFCVVVLIQVELIKHSSPATAACECPEPTPCPPTLPPVDGGECKIPPPPPVAAEEHSNKKPQQQEDGSGHSDKKGGKPPFKMQIVVFTYDRLDGLRRLMDSLVAADYSGHEGFVSCTIYFDYPKGNGLRVKGGVGDSTKKYLDELAWPHGELRIHRRQINTGLKKTILEGWYPATMEEVASFFEDDIEVAPLWFQWVREAMAHYAPPSAAAPGEIAPVDSKMLGLSLFRPIHDELSGSGCVVSNGNRPFALQQPCSWGAVYFPRPWRTFRNWYDEHSLKEPLLSDPEDSGLQPTSNTWASKSSWKKYLIKLMWERGWYMVYPNFPNRWVLSTNHLMKGEHPTPSKKLFELPLAPSSCKKEDFFHSFPELGEMEAYDVMFRKASEGVRGLPNYNKKHTV